MGRELKRVPLDFAQPLNVKWPGYLNPLYAAPPPQQAAPATGRTHELKVWSGGTGFHRDSLLRFVRHISRSTSAMTTTLTTAQVLRHAADNLEAGRDYGSGLEGRAGESYKWLPAEDFLTRLGREWQFRLSPRTITIPSYIQPEPLRVAPKEGVIVWVLLHYGVADSKWQNHKGLLGALARGNIFATKEDAEAADRIRLEAYQAVVKEGSPSVGRQD